MAEALESFWGGYRFRSRIEARWAVFLTHLRIPFEYEKQGYDLGVGVYYLPDFWLPEQDLWMEIKGAEPSSAEMQKTRHLAQQTGKRVATFFGRIPNPTPRELDGELWWQWDEPTESAYMDYPDDGWDLLHRWGECDKCGSLDIKFDGRATRNTCPCYDSDEDEGCKWWYSPKLAAAYTAARFARFEFVTAGDSAAGQPKEPRHD